MSRWPSSSERIRAKRELTSTECLVWTGRCTHDGYGMTYYEGRYQYVHRIIWQLTRGPIPAGLRALHNCDVRNCCNIEHLFLGTMQDNAIDMAKKHRGRTSFTGLPYGVTRRGDRYSVRVGRFRKIFYLGSYPTLDEAASVAAAFREGITDL